MKMRDSEFVYIRFAMGYTGSKRPLKMFMIVSLGMSCAFRSISTSSHIQFYVWFFYAYSVPGKLLRELHAWSVDTIMRMWSSWMPLSFK